ncbi:hypothetical protein CEXT_561191 [Caerostris extrusa]|uniref:Uncharacterized protein n=1 Tax=Caerostris extrusa TaxID=172846 RepID=A0AAV4M4L1_CAEEX|nr:hypothetical protein CEXT_561191 [Caerostris extrusa]
MDNNRRKENCSKSSHSRKTSSGVTAPLRERRGSTREETKSRRCTLQQKRMISGCHARATNANETSCSKSTTPPHPPFTSSPPPSHVAGAAEREKGDSSTGTDNNL